LRQVRPDRLELHLVGFGGSYDHPIEILAQFTFHYGGAKSAFQSVSSGDAAEASWCCEAQSAGAGEGRDSAKFASNSLSVSEDLLKPRFGKGSLNG